jgi:hypothetical protein
MGGSVVGIPIEVLKMDYLACPNCGNPLTDGQLCNLTCKRALSNKIRGTMVSRKEEYEMREGLKAAFVAAQAERFMLQLEAVQFDLPKIECW